MLDHRLGLDGDVFGGEISVRALPRKVDGQAGEVEKERTALILFDEGDAVLGEDARVVIAVTVDDAAELFEAEAGGHVREMETEVPLAIHGGGVAVVFLGGLRWWGYSGGGTRS